MSDTKSSCIYCGNDFAEHEFSLEHIFPDALGGNLCADTFETKRVCKRCNELMGLFVDGAVIKNWFSQNYTLESWKAYKKSPELSPQPLIYTGKLETLSTENETCELWLGPYGAQAYFFYPKDKAHYDSYAGGNPINRKKAPGYVILFGTRSDQDSILEALESCRHHFNKAARFSGNINLTDEKTRDYYFSPPDQDLEARIHSIKESANQEKHARFSVDTTTDKRFLCKVALGFGFKILGEKFLASNSAKLLRDALWERDPQLRKQHKVRGTGLFQRDDKKLLQILAWPGGHTILLKKNNDILSISIVLFGKLELHVVITDDNTLTKQLSGSFWDEGHIYVVVPQINTCTGPIELPEYIAYKYAEHKIIELDRISCQLTESPS